MAAHPLRDLGANQRISGIYSLLNPQIGTTRAGKPFLKCLLRDATGEMPARQWTIDEARVRELDRVPFVRIEGYTQSYGDQVQLILDAIEPAEVSGEELARLLPTSKHDLDGMMSELRALLGTLEHPAMRALAESFLGSDELMRRFREAPAAMSLHHAWIGGLLEHTLQLMKLAEAMLPLYPELNRDLVLMGLFLHDIGKTAELEWEQGFNYTLDGNLVGHVVRGAIWLQIKAGALKSAGQPELPPDALRVLMHIVLSHHGQMEFGAAKVPSTPEAIFISQLDNLDAKTQMALTAVDRSHEGDESLYTDKVWALETKLYRPDPLATKQPQA